MTDIPQDPVRPSRGPLSEHDIEALKEGVSSSQSLAEGEESDHPSAAYYWDASTMAPLNQTSVAAIARLRAYKPPAFPVWDRLPVTRRAAVLIVLYPDRRGDLRVVITMRAATLRNFSGHAALPGGKADNLEETPYQIARREAWEEIGLPMKDAKIPAPFRIEPLCCLPCSLARTDVVVRPCVALMQSSSADPGAPTVGESLIPRLDAKEVAAVFSAPFHNFLRAVDEVPPPLPGAPIAQPLPPGEWYEGSWSKWHAEPWRVHYFFVPVHDQRVTKPHRREDGLASLAEQPEEEEAEAAAEAAAEAEADAGRYLVWGLTGRILLDAARVAYADDPEFEHNSHYGDEAIIERLEKAGKLGEKPRRLSATASEDNKGPSKM